MRNLREILRCRIRPISKFLPAVVSCLCAVAVSLAVDNDFRLIQAVKTKDTASIRGLLKAGIDVNTPQGDGATALHWAVDDNNLAAVDLLLPSGAPVKVPNDLWVAPPY